MSICVVTDSTADIPPETREELGIHVVPLKVIFGDEEFIDGVTMQAPEFYTRLVDDDVFPTTSQPSPGEFIEAYRGLLDRFDGIVSIHISAELSGTIDSATQARAQMEDVGEAIRIVDSRSVGMGIGLVVLEAARAAQAGGDLDSVAKLAEDLVPRSGLIFLLDTLEYLRKGGRIGPASAFLGTLLRFRPLLQIDEGVVKPLARPRSRRKGIERIRAHIESVGTLHSVAVCTADDPVGAADLAQAINDLVPGELAAMSTIGPVIGAHAGPGVIGVAYLTKSV
ncbi:MAG: DegV family protein [Chloroflexi bacterium]|nr:DegV family protein [Chloroflexota bacterium]